MKAIAVTGHALAQTRDRRHFPGLTHQQVRDRIRVEVTTAIAAGRIGTSKPKWLRRGWNHLDVGRLREHLECVWDADEQLGWIIDRTGVQTVVVTALNRVRAERAAA